MSRIQARVALGVLLIIAGLFFLLQSLGIIALSVSVLSAVFAVAGLVFLSVFVSDRQNWWTAIPGFTLLGLAALLVLAESGEESAGSLGAATFLGSIALSFWLTYLTNREQWWAVIPGGAILSVAAVVGLSPIWEGSVLGGVLMLGLGLTFMLLAFLPIPGGI